MDERCKSCLRICKRLDVDDKPERYDFVNLTVDDILNLIDALVRENPYWQLCVEESERSEGDQLIISFKEKSSSCSSIEIFLIAIVHEGSAGVSLWFRFAVPDEACKHTLVVREFDDLMRRILEVLVYTDGLLVHRHASKA